MPGCQLVRSTINHTRHGTPSHFLSRKGLSLWVDLDDLQGADRQSALLSVDRFNLLSLSQRDYGPNFKKKGQSRTPQSRTPLIQLADYARSMARECCPEIDPAIDIEHVYLLTFPRILGLAFNPVSIFVLRDRSGADVMYIYEVRNTFGDMHSYIGRVEAPGFAGEKSSNSELSAPRTSGAGKRRRNVTLQTDKIFHVSPFFPVDGEYRLKMRADDCQGGDIRVLMRYTSKGVPRLTATLRGACEPLTTKSILKALIATGQWPLRPLVSIHFEAARLWLKRVPFFGRPSPPAKWSKARDITRG